MSLNPDFFFEGRCLTILPLQTNFITRALIARRSKISREHGRKLFKKISGHITLQAVTVRIDKYGHTVMANSAGISSRGLYSDKHPILYIDLNLYRP
jgi:hypothetical protein